MEQKAAPWDIRESELRERRAKAPVGTVVTASAAGLRQMPKSLAARVGDGRAGMVVSHTAARGCPVVEFPMKGRKSQLLLDSIPNFKDMFDVVADEAVVAEVRLACNFQ